MIGPTTPRRPSGVIEGLTPYENAKVMGARLMRDDILQVLNRCLAGETDQACRDAVWRCIDQVQRVSL